jgi:hypothetical protein
MYKKISVSEEPHAAALTRDTDYASLLLEELRTAEELSQRLECLENARAQRRETRPVPGTVRADLVQCVRKRIAAGAYLDDHKLDVALARLIEAEILHGSPAEPRKAAG